MYCANHCNLKNIVDTDYVKTLEKQATQARQLIGALSTKDMEMVQAVFNKHAESHSAQRALAIEQALEAAIVILTFLETTTTDPEVAESVNNVSDQLAKLRIGISSNKEIV